MCYRRPVHHSHNYRSDKCATEDLGILVTIAGKINVLQRTWARASYSHHLRSDKCATEDLGILVTITGKIIVLQRT